MIDYHAFCHIHGKYYSGWCECPICKTQKDAEKEDIKEGGKNENNI